MKKYQHSKNSIFLLEIILDIIIFSFLVIIGLKFFISTRTTTNKTTLLHNAVTCCSNVATIYQSGDGSFTTLMNEYDHSIEISDQLSIYFDKSFNECKSNNSKYHILVTPIEDNSTNLHEVEISFFDNSGDQIYDISVCKYTSNKPSFKEVTN